MGAQKNVPKKQNVKLLALTCLFGKRKFNETHNDFSINYPTITNVKRQFSVLNSSFDETTKYFGAKLIRQSNAINFSITSYLI